MRALTWLVTVVLIPASIGSSALITAPAQASASASASSSITVRDTDGTKGRFDLRSITLTKSGQAIVATVRTYERFRNVDVRGGTIGVRFDLDGPTEREANLVLRGGSLRGRICTYTTDAAPNPRNCTSVRLTRTKASVTFRIPISTIDPGARTFRWRAGSFLLSGYGGCSSRRGYCHDELPNSTRRFLSWTP